MYYQINRETQKLELIFDKAEYQALPDADKREIKSNFLFARSIGGWVSRAKWPNTGRAERVAQRLGAENRGKTGEALTFAEQQERKAERAEARAERMDARSDRAAAEGTRLQKPIEDMRGDIAFFTQPNINSSAGRAFTNRRNRMFAAYERGWEEFKKSEYYAERAETARRTAAEAKMPTDKGFCERRIAEAEKSIREQKKQIDTYRKAIEQTEKGLEYVGGPGEWYCHYTPDYTDKLREWLENAEERMEQAMSKAIYYREALEALGGIQYSRENVKPGYVVLVGSHLGEVDSCGPKNITYKVTTCGTTFYLKASYGEITEIVSAEERKPEQHPFKVGEVFEPILWDGDRFTKTPVEIVKATEKSVTVQNRNTGEKYVRKPQKYDGGRSEAAEWVFYIDSDSYRSRCAKPA